MTYIDAPFAPTKTLQPHRSRKQKNLRVLRIKRQACNINLLVVSIKTLFFKEYILSADHLSLETLENTTSDFGMKRQIHLFAFCGWDGPKNHQQMIIPAKLYLLILWTLLWL